MRRTKTLLGVTTVLLLMLGSYIAGLHAPAATGVILDNRSRSEADFSLLYKVISIIKREFYGEVEVDNQMVYGAIRGLLKSLGDDYTRFMEPKANREFKEETRGSFDGIGIYIGIRFERLTVVAPLENTPAERVGLKAGDHITAIDGVSTEDMAIEEAVSRIKGPRGTPVALSIMRRTFTEPQDFTIVRDEIHPNKATHKMLDDSIGYIRLRMFNQESRQEVLSAYRDMLGLGMKAMIIDLRNNPGGLLHVAIELADEFLSEGPIVHVEAKGGRRQTYYATSKQNINGLPIVILVNSASASASEILSGALQDNGLATIIGARTFGKGTVQQVQELDDGSAVVVTTAHYLTSKGNNINRTKDSKGGITPDVMIEEDATSMEEFCREYLDPTVVDEVDGEDPFIKAAVEQLKEQLAR